MHFFSPRIKSNSKCARKKKKKVLIQPNFLGWNKEQQNYRPKLWTLFFFFFYVSEGKGWNFLLLANELLRTIMEMVPIKEGPNFILFSECKKVLIDYSNIINFSYQKTIYINIYIFFFSSPACVIVGAVLVWLGSLLPSSSSFLEIMMNKDFWGFFFSSDKLSVALNDMVLGRSLWIY